MDDRLDRDVVRSLHAQLLQGDRLASEKLATLLLPTLSEEIGRSFPKVDDQIVFDGVIDAVFDYCSAPTTFDATRQVPLDRFLSIVARRNVTNALLGERRRKLRERKVAEKKPEMTVALDPLARKVKQEERAERRKQRAALLKSLPNPKDRELLRLKLNGVKDTAAFAQVLGIAHLPVEEQRKEVKRHKDRIAQFLRRKGLL